MLKWILCGAIALALLATAGCAFDPTDMLGRKDSLHWAQKRYSQLVRWGEIERAAKYIDPEQREEFLEVARGFRGVRFTDYEIQEIEIEDGSHDATVRVTYSGYLPSAPVERHFDEVQHWHREDGNTWLLRTELAQLREALDAWARP